MSTKLDVQGSVNLSVVHMEQAIKQIGLLNQMEMFSMDDLADMGVALTQLRKLAKQFNERMQVFVEMARLRDANNYTNVGDSETLSG